MHFDELPSNATETAKHPTAQQENNDTIKRRQRKKPITHIFRTDIKYITQCPPCLRHANSKLWVISDHQSELETHWIMNFCVCVCVFLVSLPIHQRRRCIGDIVVVATMTCSMHEAHFRSNTHSNVTWGLMLNASKTFRRVFKSLRLKWERESESAQMHKSKITSFISNPRPLNHILKLSNAIVRDWRDFIWFEWCDIPQNDKMWTNKTTENRTLRIDRTIARAFATSTDEKYKK